MKVIVTGGSGRVGKAVLKTLCQRGHEVMNLDRRPAGDDRPGKFVYMDLRSRESLQPVMEQAEALVHMGEIPSAKSGHNTEEAVYGTNCTVGSLILQLASELKYKRVLYASSIDVYGFTEAGAAPPMVLPVDESHPLQPQNGYALGKIAIEDYARLCAQKHGLSVAAFRLPWVLTQEIDSHWFHWVEHEKRIRRDLGSYVKDSDAAECFALALEKQLPGFEAYHLAAKEVIYASDLREALARDLPDYPRLPEGWGKYQTPYLWKKAQEHFGWEPKWNFLDLLRAQLGREPQLKD